MAEVTYRLYRPGDEERINAEFNRVFGLDRPLAEWRWKYPAEPEGRWIMVAAGERDRILAHYGAVPVRLRVEALEVRAGQICDVYTVPETRHGLAAARTSIATVHAFYAQCGAPDKLALLYGFPGTRHLSLGLARLGYDEMPPQPVPVWRRSPERRARLFSGHAVRAGFDAGAAGALWSGACARYPVAAVRGAAWLSRRFTGRPGVEYVHLVARRRGRPAALAVVRLQGRLASWADLVWDGEDRRALAALDRAVVAVARRAGAAGLEMWLDGDDAAEAVFAGLGWERGTHPDGLVMVARSFHPEIAAASFAGRFYLTMGDADLV